MEVFVHFHLDISGFMAVPGAAGGQFFGGVLCKKLNLKVKGCIRVAIVCCSLTVVMSAAMWAKCDLGNFAGVTTHYNSNRYHCPNYALSLNATGLT